MGLEQWRKRTRTDGVMHESATALPLLPLLCSLFAAAGMTPGDKPSSCASGAFTDPHHAAVASSSGRSVGPLLGRACHCSCSCVALTRRCTNGSRAVPHSCTSGASGEQQTADERRGDASSSKQRHPRGFVSRKEILHVAPVEFAP